MSTKKVKKSARRRGSVFTPDALASTTKSYQLSIPLLMGTLKLQIDTVNSIIRKDRKKEDINHPATYPLYIFVGYKMVEAPFKKKKVIAAVYNVYRVSRRMYFGYTATETMS